jgi:hypothetical protein
MWTKSVTILDEPDKIGPFELMDAAILLGLFVFVFAWQGVLIGLGVLATCGGGLYWLKRGKPYGWLLQKLHALMLDFGWLRRWGFHSPRYIEYGAN